MNLKEKIDKQIGKKLFCCLGEQIQDFVGVKYNGRVSYLDNNTIACIVYGRIKSSLGTIDSIDFSIERKLNFYDFKRKN